MQTIDKVPHAEMLRAWKNSGLNYNEAARAVGRKDGGALSKRLRNGKDFPYEEAAEYIKAWGLDPVDYGV
jgi:hypothetical protein